MSNAVGVIAIGFVLKDSIGNTTCSSEPDYLRHSSISPFIHMVQQKMWCLIRGFTIFFVIIIWYSEPNTSLGM